MYFAKDFSMKQKKSQILTLCFLLYRLNSSEGWLADAVGNYTVDSKCTWLIEAPSADSNIRLHLKEFATECSWDHLYIFDGIQFSSMSWAFFQVCYFSLQIYSVLPGTFSQWHCDCGKTTTTDTCKSGYLWGTIFLPGG